uniref:Protein kinase domain-containing protein n=2 Tax=Kalanchoe fedtschenkoi TaxID=63787 RepID=A0A7N0RH35_KALFE
MAQSTIGSRRMIGDYQVGRKIGSGSFSVVWHAKHSVLGTEVAIKEIVTDKLSNKLQDSLKYEIFVLKKIYHPNIIYLHDIIEEPRKIHLVLEYCKGGDLSVYINRNGKVPEATAKHFMRQLAAGLQVLHDNNLIHRDLKPQNLLLSTNDNKAVLKIADFGFARLLQPRGLAETLCGSPLYMAPEIMQLQKYDAKADMWSVGAILFQLVTGRTPFNGNSQVQLLQNIIKSTDLYFPPNNNGLTSDCKDLCRKLLRRNPVERLTFEEFFNHPFLSAEQPENSSRHNNSARALEDFQLSDSGYTRNTDEVSQEDYLPFPLDDNSSGPDGSPSSLRRKPVFGFPVPSNLDRGHVTPTISYNILDTSTNEVKNKNEHSRDPMGAQKPVHGNLETEKYSNYRSSNAQSKVGDSLELSDLDYVIVSGPPLDGSSFVASAAKLDHPLIVGTTTSCLCRMGSLESQNSAPGTSQGSMDYADSLERPSTYGLTRIKSLQQCAATINELVNEKMKSAKQLEAFSIQLVILAIWKQALHICHTRAASAMEGSPNQHSAKWRSSGRNRTSSDMQESLDISNDELPEDLSSKIEREFLTEVGRAEELAQVIDAGSAEMPDAMETIFQSALSLGRIGAVDELLGDVENASVLYSKAVQLLVFILVEAPSLILNPPLSLTSSDRYRLRTYIDILKNRLGHSRSQRLALLKTGELPSPP